MEENNKELLEQNVMVVPNHRMVIETRINVLKRPEELTEEERQERYIKSLTSNDDDEDDTPKDSDFQWLPITLDFAKVTGVSEADNGLASLWFGMENGVYDIEYELALALFYGDIFDDDNEEE